MHEPRALISPSSRSYPNRDDPIARGNDALSHGEWREALAAFEQACIETENSEALEGLGLAAWWLDDAAIVFDARERAYKLYKDAGDNRGAARVAMWLARDYCAFRGEFTVSAGWLERARGLLESEPPCEEHGWLALRDVQNILKQRGDPSLALKLTREAAQLASGLGDTGLEMVARSIEGIALITAGEADAGLTRLDEAAAAVASGEVADLLSIGLASCNLIAGYERVRDYPRAVRWCERLKAFCRLWNHPPLFAVCRTLYADVLIGRGQWHEAEQELASAAIEFALVRPAMKVDAAVRLAELRRRRGQYVEAHALLQESEGHPLARLVEIELALDESRLGAAVELTERFLRSLSVGHLTDRATALELLIRAEVRYGRGNHAAAALERLSAIALRIGTVPLRASLHYAQGLVRSTQGDLPAARRHLEEAVDTFTQCAAPFEAARARCELASTWARLGRKDVALDEANRAATMFERIGAAAEHARASALVLDLLSPEPSDVEDCELSRLTRREQQILREVAQGKTNAQIAAELCLSGHTVHRHVANILSKLDLRSRVAASALAAARGLL